MNQYFYLIPVFLPVVLGGLLLLLPCKRNFPGWFCLGVTVPMAVLVWVLSLHTPEALVFNVPAGKLEVGFCLDGTGRVFAMMASALWVPAALYGVEYMRDDPRQRSFFAFYLMCLGATVGIAMAENLLTMYIFYEFLTLFTIPLVVHPLTPEAVSATKKYMYMSFGGTAFAFIALVFINVYGSVGAFAAGGLFTVSDRSPLLLGVWFLGFLGFGVKAAIFPLHSWLPDAAVAPTPVTALLHAVAVVKAGIFAIVRLTYFCFGAEFIQGTAVHRIALGLAIFTTLYGSVAAVRERHLKRRLAYSTVANLSYILSGFLLLTPEGASAGFLHMIAHGLLKISAFFCVGAVMKYRGVTTLSQLGGQGRHMPWMFGCFTLAGLGLAGIPPTVGFISKFRLIAAGLAEGSVWGVAAAVALLVCGLLTAVYMLTVTVKAFLVPEETAVQVGSGKKPGAAMTVAVLTVTAAGLVLGVYCESVVRFVTGVAAEMFY